MTYWLSRSVERDDRSLTQPRRSKPDGLGANVHSVRDNNMQVVLQALRLNVATTRRALAEHTGLSSQSVSNVVQRLEAAELVRAIGVVRCGRGQPAVQLTVNAAGAYGIGLHVDTDRFALAVVDLKGEVQAYKATTSDGNGSAAVIRFLERSFKALIADGKFIQTKVLGIGLAFSKVLPRDLCEEIYDACFLWANHMSPHQICSDNSYTIQADYEAATAARWELQYAQDANSRSLFYLHVSASVSGSPVFNGRIFHGASYCSGEIGKMPTLGQGLVQDVVSISVLNRRLSDEEQYLAYVERLPEHDLAVSSVVRQWLEDATSALMNPLTAASSLLCPTHIVIGGRLPASLIERLSARLNARLSRDCAVRCVPVRPGRTPTQAAASGAGLLPFRHLLPD